MKGRRKITVAVMVILALASYLAAVQVAQAATVAWKDYEEARKLSKATGKHLLINFYADWCAYCKMMDKSTFQDEKVVAYMNQHFVSAKVNSGKNRALAREFSVRGVPATWFVKPDGTKLTYIPGLVKPDLFLWVLKYISSKSYESKSFKDFLKDNGAEDVIPK